MGQDALTACCVAATLLQCLLFQGYCIQSHVFPIAHVSQWNYERHVHTQQATAAVTMLGLES